MPEVVAVRDSGEIQILTKAMHIFRRKTKIMLALTKPDAKPIEADTLADQTEITHCDVNRRRFRKSLTAGERL